MRYAYRSGLRWLGTLLCTCYLAGGTLVSAAAEATSSSDARCEVELTGPIDQGDAERFKAFIQNYLKNHPHTDYEYGEFGDFTLCLEGPGGNYADGMSIARFVFDNGIKTRVLPRKSCYSACALIFMAGRSSGSEFDHPHRTMDITSTIGFHAPYLALDGTRTFSAAEVNFTAALQNAIIGNFISMVAQQTFESYKPIISMTLLQQILLMGPDEFEIVDTLEEIALWGINLEGVAGSFAVSERDMLQLCENFSSWYRDARASRDEPYPRELPSISGNLYGKSAEFKIATLTDLTGAHCRVEQNHTADRPTIALCLYDNDRGVTIGDCATEGTATYLPTYFAFPPSTPLNQLNTTLRQKHSFRPLFMGVRDQKLCITASGKLNLRDRDNTEGGIVDQLEGDSCTLTLVHDCNGLWCYVRTDKDRYGYVHSDYVRLR